MARRDIALAVLGAAFVIGAYVGGVKLNDWLAR